MSLPIVLSASSERARATATALAALGADQGSLAPGGPGPLGDLAQLLAPEAGSALIVVEPGDVPGEDVGILRRHLERWPDSRLVVIGEDAAQLTPLAPVLLAWPPHLEQLTELLGPASEPSRGSGQEQGSPSSSGRSRPRTDGKRSAAAAPPSGPRPPARTNAGEEADVERLDLTQLLEAEVTHAALRSDPPTRFRFHGSEGAYVASPRRPLAEALRAFVDLARGAAAGGGSDATVETRVTPAPDEVEVRFTFASTRWQEAGLEHGQVPFAQDEGDARAAVEWVRGQGGAVGLERAGPGRVRLRVTLGRAS